MEWWSTASPYHYVRTEEQDDHDILVVGGGDHLTGARTFIEALRHIP